MEMIQEEQHRAEIPRAALLPGTATQPAAEAVDALLVIHGMGEQLRFSALDAVVEGLHLVGGIDGAAKAETISDGNDGTLQRLEVTIASEGRKRKLHLYEAYWAPVTEGEVGVKDTIDFLFSGAWNGIRRIVNRRWQRWMFGADHKFKIPTSTPLQLLVALTTIFGLVILNLLALAVAGSGVSFITIGLSTRPLLLDLSTTLGFVALQVIVLAMLLIVAKACGDAPVGIRRTVSAITFGAFYASLTAISACVAIVPLQIAFHLARSLIRDTAGDVSTFWPAIRVGLFATVIVCVVAYFVKARWIRGLGQLIAVVTLVPAVLLAMILVINLLVDLYDRLSGPCHSLWVVLWLQGPSVHPRLDWWTHPIVYGLAWLVALTALVVWPERQKENDQSAWVRYVASFVLCVSTLIVVYRIGYAISSLYPPVGINPCTARGVFRHDEISMILPWFIVIAISTFAKWFLSQYLGDVAAYVSSNRLDHFFRIRKEIQDIAARVANSIYASTQPRYARVGVMAHSLGSVIAYDTINRMMNIDALAGDALRVVERTTLLLTFGSPLDKTAYVFSTSTGQDDPTRDVLAAAVQPLILDEKYRKNLRWINVWSPNDIISGRLKFYDAPSKPVENFVDEDASVPLAAHVQYWRNRMVFSKVVDWALQR